MPLCYQDDFHFVVFTPPVRRNRVTGDTPVPIEGQNPACSVKYRMDPACVRNIDLTKRPQNLAKIIVAKLPDSGGRYPVSVCSEWPFDSEGWIS